MLPQRKRLLLRVCAVTSVGLGVAVTAGWFLWLIPKISRQDPLWEERFSAKAKWTQVQKAIRRYGWNHDDFFNVGRYGDKSWAQWIIAKAVAGEEIATCGSVGHEDEALKFITCQDPAPGTNYHTEAQWVGWWKTNNEKSQVEWVQSGLSRFGDKVHLPPTSSDTELLLRLLGNQSTNLTEKIPAQVKYNAFRWLRDSDFDVIAYAVSNITAQTSETVCTGALEYGKFEKLFPKRDKIGVLPLKPVAGEDETRHTIAFYDPKVQISGYTAMVLPMIVGIWLWRYSKTQLVE